MAEINIIIITYFFLLLPGEYMASKSYITLFRLEDTVFSCSHSVFAATGTEGDLQAAKFVTMKFKTQENGFRGRNRTQGIRVPKFVPQGGPLRWVLHLRDQGALPSIPLSRVMNLMGRWVNITPTMISKTLKTAIGFYGPKLGCKAKDMSSRSLRAAGSVALFFS